MLRLFWRRAFAMLFLLVIVSCAGGGGCAGCGAEPIAGGFPRDGVIENAASVRITRPGLDFLAANMPKVITTVLKNNGTMSFDIPKTDQSASFGSGIFSVTFNAHICPDGANHAANPPTCVVDVGIGDAKMKLDAITAHSIKITGTIPVRLKDLPINVDNTGPDLGDMDVGLGTGQCNGGTPAYDYKAFPVNIVIPIVKQTIAPRDGYSFLDINNAVIDPQVTKDDVSVCKSCGFATGICNGFFDFVKDQVFNSIVGGIKTKLKDLLKDQLCTKPNTALTPQCPTGSLVSADKSQCVFATKPDTCVPTELGTNGHIDLSGALASISPGTSGGFNFVLAAGGDMDPAPGLPADNVGYAGHTPNGITLPMLGGALPVPQSSCVPVFKNVPPTGIPIPDELKKDKQVPWITTDPTGPHVGIALSGRFLNYAFGSIYNSGLLCLGVSTEQFQQLQSGLISALIPSMKKLTFEQKAAPVAITTRPQVPPKVTLGTGKDIKTDPLLKIELKSFAVDFYVWSMDRYVRAFTFTGDLTIPVNLQTAKDPKTNPNGGLLPIIGEIAIANPVVTNNELLTDDPQLIGDSLASIMGGLTSQLTGGIKPFDLSGAFKSFNLALTVPDGGIRKLTKGTDDYLGIFANLAIAQPANVEADAQVRIVGKTVHPEAMSLLTARRELLPELHVMFSSPMDNGTHAIEYSYSFDQGARSAWSPERDVTIKDDYLFFQGKHTLHAWARIAGEQLTEDSTPAEAAFTIDTLPPNAEFKEGTKSGEMTLQAWDVVSEESALQVRFKATDSKASNELASFGAWMSVAEANKALLALPSTTLNVDVEVKDEEGNVGTTSSALIRGKPDDSLAAAGGCGCSTPGTSSNVPGGWAFLGGIGLFAFGWRRRMRSGAAAVGLGTVAVIGSGATGCDCGGDTNNGTNEVGCGTDCKQPCHGALPLGMVGTYTSVATAKDGSIWVAGYNDAALSNDGNFLYGDLVVGKYDGAKQQVAWATVDGNFIRSDGSCPESDRAGWRGGETEAGDDVGLWTSIQLDAEDRPIVSYYDATNKALKFAFFEGGKWSSFAVLGAPGADIGRYSKMILVGGNPVIAFAVLEKGNAGALRSKISLAKATGPNPRGPGDWAIEDVAVDETGPCRAFTCDGSDVCVKATGTCMPAIGGCTPADCGANNACVTIGGKATCSATISASFVEAYPNALGDYISMTEGPQGIGIVAYDRIRGNLVGYANTGGAWAATILDGETGSRSAKTARDTGDTGIGASLAITSNGDWHVSYVNGVTETLNYVLVPGGKTALKPEIIDDGAGYGVGSTPFGDGRHVVGDDSHLMVVDGGAVTVVYQDATAGELRYASGSPTGQTHTWTVKAIAQPNRFAGFFPHPVPGGSQQIINWWRATDHATQAITGDVSFVTP